MARNNWTSFLGPLTVVFYLVLLFSPLALVGTAQAQSDQDVLTESYGTVIGIDLGSKSPLLVCCYHAEVLRRNDIPVALFWAGDAFAELGICKNR